MVWERERDQAQAQPEGTEQQSAGSPLDPDIMCSASQTALVPAGGTVCAAVPSAGKAPEHSASRHRSAAQQPDAVLLCRITRVTISRPLFMLLQRLFVVLPPQRLAPIASAAQCVHHLITEAARRSCVQVRMRDPVIAADGQTYERTAIEGWLAAGSLRSPVTGQLMPSAALLPNLAIRDLVQRSH